MGQPLDSVQAKLERSWDHMKAFYETYQATLDTNPIRFGLDPGDKPGHYVAKVESVPELPPKISVILGDVLHEFRSALDHLVHQLALLRTPTPNKRAQFPIMRKQADFRAQCHMLADLSPEHQAMVERFQPYNRGNTVSPLLALNELVNRDKHRELNPMMIRVLIPSPTMVGVNCTLANVEWIHSPDGPLDIGTEIARLEINNPPAQPHVQMKGNLIPQVAFREIGAYGRRSDVVSVFLSIGGEVLLIAHEFERFLEPRARFTRSPRKWPGFSTWTPPNWPPWVTGH